MGLQIDGVKLALYAENEPDFSSFRTKASYPSMITRYASKEVNSLQITHNPRTQKLIIDGSPMYLFQGHNFVFSRNGFIEVFNDLSNRLGVNLWEAEVVEFEFGAIIPVEADAKEYIRKHPSATGLETFDNPTHKGNMRCYADKQVRLKLYNVNWNIRHYRKANKVRAQADGWNPAQNYLKFEVRYLKPAAIFQGHSITLYKLVQPGTWQRCCKDLYSQYQRLHKVQQLARPASKKELSAPDIILTVLVELAIQSDQSIPQIKEMLFEKINEFKELLSPADRASRRKSIEKGIEKLLFDGSKNRWDLSEKLAKLTEITTNVQQST